MKLSHVLINKDDGSPNEPDPTTETFSRFDLCGLLAL